MGEATMDQPMTKLRFLELLLAERERWDAVLALVGPARMTQPGLPGGWTIKDTVAHVAWFEREMVGMLRERALAGSDLWQFPPDERNAAIHAENRDRMLDEVLASERETYRQLLDAIKRLTDEELLDPGYFLGMPVEWTPWQVLADNCFAHYQAHLPDIRAWLEGHEEAG
jgi:uncharacterized protein (TIGR03083 family)